MRRSMRSGGLMVMAVCAATMAAESPRPVLVPAVKQIRWSEGGPIVLAKGTAAIVRRRSRRNSLRRICYSAWSPSVSDRPGRW